MRTLAITQNITVDGSIEMLGDWFDPQAQAKVDNSDLLGELHRQDSAADGLLVGRQAFEDLRGYWPQQTDDATGIADYLNRVHEYVVSSTMVDPQWQPSTVLSGDPIAQVPGPEGGTRTRHRGHGQHHALPRPDRGWPGRRVSTLRLPRGAGPRTQAVPQGLEVPKLRLLDAKTFRGGITYSRYAPA